MKLINNLRGSSTSRRVLRVLLGLGVIFCLLFVSQDATYRRHIINRKLPNTYYLLSTLNYETSKYPNNTSELSRVINEHNKKERILNLKKFGAITNDTTIIVILQVGQDIEYLKFLISSLSHCKNIQDTLIVFSHYYYDERINYMIGKIKFCKVLQIYNPLLINPDFGRRLAGNSLQRDRKVKKIFKSLKSGHPKDRRRKHHWWWTANTVFDKLKCTSAHEGLVVFADDDSYFLEDSIYMLNLMRHISKSVVQCDFISIGENTLGTSEIADLSALEVVTWNAKDYSAVLGFDVSTWRTIVSHYNVFCNVEDYAWARSLYYMTLHRRDNKQYRVISTLHPRAYKLSVRDYSIPNYNIFLSGLTNRLYHILESQIRIERLFFPAKVDIMTDIELEDDNSMEYEFPRGGWGLSDKELCTNTTVQKFAKVLLDMEAQFAEHEPP